MSHPIACLLVLATAVLLVAGAMLIGVFFRERS